MKPCPALSASTSKPRPTSPKPTLKNPKTPKPSETATNPLLLKTPKLLFPTLAVFLCTALLFLFTYTPYIHSSSTSVNILIDIFHFALIPLTPALGLFLLHRLLEIAILHCTFRPIHLLSIIAIILSASVYYPITALLIICIVFYLVAAVVFAASLSFQKKHSLATDPAHFRSSLLSTAVASAVLGFINLLTLALQVIPTGLPYQISGPLFNFLISASVIAILPLQLCLTFLVLTKLAPAKSASPSTSTTPAKPSIPSAPHPAKPASPLSHPNLFIIHLSLLLTVTTSITYLAYFEHLISKEYSTPHNCCQHFD